MKHDKEYIARWLRMHPLINISKLERMCGIPQSALNKAVKGDSTKLSDKHLSALTTTLQQYGFR